MTFGLADAAHMRAQEDVMVGSAAQDGKRTDLSQPG
jgi:hypothetical protein